MKKFVNLYRHILRLHRLLPSEMRIIGDNFVKPEFKRHSKVTDHAILETFYTEWASYSEFLFKQSVKANSVGKSFGAKIDLKRLSQFNDDQLYNLMELRKHALSDGNKDENSSKEVKDKFVNK